MMFPSFLHYLRLTSSHTKVSSSQDPCQRNETSFLCTFKKNKLKRAVNAALLGCRCLACRVGRDIRPHAFSTTWHEPPIPVHVCRPPYLWQTWHPASISCHRPARLRVPRNAPHSAPPTPAACAPGGPSVAPSWKPIRRHDRHPCA